MREGRIPFPGAVHRRDIAAAILCVVAAFAVRWLLLPALGSATPFITFYPALTLAALFAGWWAGLLATLLSAVIANYFWMPPVGSLAIKSPADALAFVLFLISGALIAYVAELSRRSNARLRQSEARQRQALERQIAAAAVELRQSERRFRTALTGSPVSIWEQDRELRYTWFWNPKLGYALPEVIGHTDAELMDPACLPALEAIKRGVIASGQAARQEVSVAAPGGPTRHYDLYAEPLHGPDGLIGITCVAIDITRRHVVEEQLRGLTARLELRVREEIAAREATLLRLAQRELLRAIGDSSADAIYAKDIDGRFLYANPAVLGIIGKGAEAVIGATDAEFHADPEQAAAVMANDRRIMQGGAPEVIEETFDAAAQGRRIFRSAKAPLRGENGAVIGIVGVSSDITDIRAAEQKLREWAATLEARVQTEVAARETAQARLAHAQRMEALGQLAGGIAHDFNNVLSAVQGGARLIEGAADEPERVRRIARMIAEASHRGAAITRRLLAFARRADLLIEPVETAFLFEAIQEILSHTLGAAIVVRGEIEDGLPPLLADKGQLETVLVNLATNARDAMQGSGTITLAARLDVVRQDDGAGHPVNLAAGSYICLAVRDTGDGMTPEMLARATEPFFTTKEDGRGTGLGLSMARGFAEQSGGGMLIESAPGRGTIVKLWFPIAEDSGPDLAIPARPAMAAAITGAAQARLLVVDDDPLVMETTAEQMEAEGYTVVRATSAGAALDHLRNDDAIDLLVTDLTMPGMDGLALIQEAQRLRPGLPAIIATGFATDAVEQAMHNDLCGRFTLLRKPIVARRLAEQAALLLAGLSSTAG